MKKNYPLPSVVVKKNTTTKTTKDNNPLISCLKIVVQGCPKLSQKKHTETTRVASVWYQKNYVEI